MARVNAQRWRGHVEAAEGKGMTLAAYAREHGLSKYTLYEARRALCGGAAGGGVGKETGFVPVRVAEFATVTARLPNGVEVSLPVAGREAFKEWLSALAGLSCGA